MNQYKDLDQSKNPLKHQRNKEFARACISILEENCRNGVDESIDDVLRRAIKTKPSCFHVEFETASKKLANYNPYLKNEVHLNKINGQMWHELFDTMMECKRLIPNPNFTKVLSYVLNFRSPSRFYISMDTARNIIRPYMKKIALYGIQSVKL